MATPIRAAYWNSATAGSFPIASIGTSSPLFNHIHYAFLQPHSTTFRLDISDRDRALLTEFNTSLHTLSPAVKTVLSIGGPSSNVDVFSGMASSEVNRQAFITSTIDIARQYDFDGVGLDWEFPSQVDMPNLAQLYEEWASALEKDGAINRRKPRLLLTSTVYYAPEIVSRNRSGKYPVDAISKYVDLVYPKCFDYGVDAYITAAPAALNDPSGNNKSTSSGITSWIDAGVPAIKLVMGLPLYGKSWKLNDPRVHGIGAPAIPLGSAGDVSYKVIALKNAETNAVVKYDDQTVSHYSYSGLTWIGYDDFESVDSKVHFAKNQGLGGYFFWDLGQDKVANNQWTLSLSRRAYHAWGA